jgi:plastocyanin
VSRGIQACRTRRLLLGLPALLAVLALTSACGPTPKKPGGGGKSSSASGSTTVSVKNFAFEPQRLTVSKGTKVTWKFEDTTAHTATANDKSFDSKGLKSGATYSFTFTKPGSYQYLCTFHQYMTGTVTVK